MAERTILVVGETHKSELRPASLEAVKAAQTIAGAVGASVVAGIASPTLAAAQTLAGTGVERVVAIGHDAFDAFTTEAAVAAAAALIEAARPQVVLIPGTTAGRDYAPRLAARLQAVSAADVIALEARDGAIEATRPVYGGKMLSTLSLPADRVSIVTLRPGSFEKAESGGGAAQIEAIPFTLPDTAARVHVEGLIQEETAGPVKLEEAQVIVSGGRGLKEPQNFAMIEQLATALGGVVGASRAVVDAGWRKHHEQVGQTGRTVSPRLYVAVGISGAVQHLVGMQGSEYIVAINRDPDAPIFRLASFGIVGDLFEIVPALVTELSAA
jgi:electron transfer flavoprotein alpha subunit